MYNYSTHYLSTKWLICAYKGLIHQIQQVVSDISYPAGLLALIICMLNKSNIDEELYELLKKIEVPNKFPWSSFMQFQFFLISQENLTEVYIYQMEYNNSSFNF